MGRHCVVDKIVTFWGPEFPFFSDADPLLIADYIRVQLGKRENIFENLLPPFVVGSLKESSRLFFYGEDIY